MVNEVSTVCDDGLSVFSSDSSLASNSDQNVIFVSLLVPHPTSVTGSHIATRPLPITELITNTNFEGMYTSEHSCPSVHFPCSHWFLLMFPDNDEHVTTREFITEIKQLTRQRNTLRGNVRFLEDEKVKLEADHQVQLLRMAAVHEKQLIDMKLAYEKQLIDAKADFDEVDLRRKAQCELEMQQERKALQEKVQDKVLKVDSHLSQLLAQSTDLSPSTSSSTTSSPKFLFENQSELSAIATTPSDDSDPTAKLSEFFKGVIDSIKSHLNESMNIEGGGNSIDTAAAQDEFNAASYALVDIADQILGKLMQTAAAKSDELTGLDRDFRVKIIGKLEEAYQKIAP